ncbi:hypothetical protein GQ53DRAFT_708649 [Thozetella sp. PMI_491]|nr:hypothetical protein GQ53DRAFT_708649 [Thozetella sp. PMI_491]
MGNQASVPKPGAEFQVIGAGLPRTGTASFSEALRILLDGPVYHGGTQMTRGASKEILDWNKLLSRWPPKNDADRKRVMDILKAQFDGYVATTDTPGAQLFPQLLELYPNAIVICTVRDPESWTRSMAAIATAATLWFLRFVLLPLPTMRHFPDYINHLRGLYSDIYGEIEPPTEHTYHYHIDWLKRTVPKDRLFFLDVRDGWEPLCKALGKKVPENVPFPRINDGEAIERLTKEMVGRGLMRWLGLFATVGIAFGGYYLLL